jgi:predicted RNase H-like HicB family nuclease
MPPDSAETRGSGLIHGELDRKFVDRSNELRPVRVFILEDEGGGFAAIVPELPGVASQGASVEDAMRMTQEALELAVESYRAKGLPIPLVSLSESPVNPEDLRGAEVRWTLV